MTARAARPPPYFISPTASSTNAFFRGLIVFPRGFTARPNVRNAFANPCFFTLFCRPPYCISPIASSTNAFFRGLIVFPRGFTARPNVRNALAVHFFLIFGSAFCFY